jgi:para-nitrobenzyl esterase
MRTYWTGMARLGTPNLPEMPFWPAFQAGSQRMISLVPPQPQAEQGFAAAHHCAFWASLASGAVH